MKVYKKSFGYHQSQEYQEIWIHNDDVTITFSNLGARINRWFINERNDIRHLILGAENASQVFEQASYFFGATVIPVAGRIKNGFVDSEGLILNLDQNDKGNHLHGGFNSSNLMLFDMELYQEDDNIKVVFRKEMLDGLGGYPGHRVFKIIHTYTKNNEWHVEYNFKTDQPTLFNPTNHVYFNLDDVRRNTVKDHHLTIDADSYLPLNTKGLPKGVIAELDNTPFDFRQGKRLADALASDDEQIKQVGGIDHCFLFNESNDGAILLRLESSDQKVAINVKTNENSVVIYTTNVVGDKDDVWGTPLLKYSGIAIETQSPPDAPTYPEFGSIVFGPDEVFKSSTTYQLNYKNEE